jgi:diaminohydroxyphosphoribosylaminopyrimidine deaminase/5-amino-6-(5-phosphoribosylamino)uracil reductase
MVRALTLARRAMGRTDPNPLVGAVLVKRGRIVGKGYHHAAGKPHAEVEAILDAGGQAAGSDLFVTLEPCNHQGRTPPCTRAVIEAGIKRVWYGMADPNPDVAGGGLEALRKAGIEVFGPVLEDRCRRLNEIFITNVTERRPFVFLKLAMSLDGRIATRTGHSQWITSEASRHRVHRLRDRVSAIMVGIGTILADDPALTTRLPGRRGRDPIRIVADSHLRTPPDAAVINPSSRVGLFIGCRREPPYKRRRQLEERGVVIIATQRAHRTDLRELLDRLYPRRITSVLIEGGATLAEAALKARLVDRCLFFYAPLILGGRKAPGGIGGSGVARLGQAPRLEEVETSRVGPDILVTGRVRYPDVA